MRGDKAERGKRKGEEKGKKERKKREEIGGEKEEREG